MASLWLIRIASIVTPVFGAIFKKTKGSLNTSTVIP